VTAAGSMFGGIPWWVWLLIAVLVVLVLAKK
jgi:Sec-independent protein translocase protein TatA